MSGHVASSRVEVSRSSARPFASFARTFAVAGATTATSDARAQLNVHDLARVDPTARCGRGCR